MRHCLTFSRSHSRGSHSIAAASEWSPGESATSLSAGTVHSKFGRLARPGCNASDGRSGTEGAGSWTGAENRGLFSSCGTRARRHSPATWRACATHIKESAGRFCFRIRSFSPGTGRDARVLSEASRRASAAKQGGPNADKRCIQTQNICCVHTAKDHEQRVSFWGARQDEEQAAGVEILRCNGAIRANLVLGGWAKGPPPPVC